RGKMLRINEVSVPLNFTEQDIIQTISGRLGVKPEAILSHSIWKKSIDARKRTDIRYVLTVNITLTENVEIKDKKTVEVQLCDYCVPVSEKLAKRPVVVGFGPGGMFAALILAQSGQCPIVFERGSCVEDRNVQVQNFWKNKVLNVQSNVQFGEGGAGTFSDGKLSTGIKDERIRKVLEEFVQNGAPQDILWEAKPHIGTDYLPKVVKNIREKIQSMGGEVFFDSVVTDVKIVNEKISGVTVCRGAEESLVETDHVVLCIGHSARDTFRMLEAKKIPLEPKAFSIGARIEHNAEQLNQSQYGDAHGKLPAAEYKLAAHLANGRGVYTFCMCPGGQVVGAASVENAVVTNGMSTYARDGVNSNSAILVGVTPQDFGSAAPLAGIDFQESIEKAAFLMAGGDYSAPVQRVEDFLANRPTTHFGAVQPTYRPGTAFADINRLLPEYITKSMKAGIMNFAGKIHPFNNPDALLTAPETRSSSPVRILRNEKMESLGVGGLYPCGEGAGYAGGIVSAAVDGIRCAEAILEK
ncbi:MAG: hypothetical protein RSC76_02840, partial [Oscillospiraceae bacterium]